MTEENNRNSIFEYLNTYKVHYTIGALVYLSFAISGFKFDIVESSTLTRLIYGLLQVSTIVLFLSLSKELILNLYPDIKSRFKIHLFAISIGTLGSFLFDYVLIKFFELIDPNCKFQSSGYINPEFISYIKYYGISFLEDLKYPVVFWPLCELADSYLNNLAKAIKTEAIIEKTSFEDLPFLKDIPKLKRKDLLAIEAQQNYIQLIYPDTNYTILYRLKDALILIPSELGMKVHRSYWVSFQAIVQIKNSGLVVLTNGKEIPVSRSFSKKLKEKTGN